MVCESGILLKNHISCNFTFKCYITISFQQFIKTLNHFIFTDLLVGQLMDRLDVGNFNISKVWWIKSIRNRKNWYSHNHQNWTFSLNLFSLNGFLQPIRLERNHNEDSIMIYVRKDIPTKELTFVNLPHYMGNIFVEINLLNWKWLLRGCCHPPGQQDIYFFNQAGNVLNKYTLNYQKVILTRDFNTENSEQSLNFYVNVKLKL